MDGGVTFTTPIALIEPEAEANLPDIAVADTDVYVVYEQVGDSLNNRDVFLIRGTDTAVGGTVFADPINLSNSPIYNAFPRIDVSGSNVAVQWENRQGVPVNNEVVFVGSTDGGATFGSQVSVTGMARGALNDIAISGNNLFSTWSVPGGDYDVLFAKGTLTPIENTPPETLIISVISGNNVHLNNGDSTSSDTITFTFTGTDDVAVVGFECRLDGTSQIFAPCTSSITYANLNTGMHTFEVRAIDTSGNIDPTPASFSWKILTPQEAIRMISDTINSMNLPKGTETSLNGPLHNAIQLLEDHDPTNDISVCDKLASFIEQVNAKEANGQLTLDQAVELRQQAMDLQNSLGCPPTTLVILPH